MPPVPAVPPLPVLPAPDGAAGPGVLLLPLPLQPIVSRQVPSRTAKVRREAQVIAAPFTLKSHCTQTTPTMPAPPSDGPWTLQK